LTRLNATKLRTLNRVLLALHEDLIEPMPLESFIGLFESLLPVSRISIDEAAAGSGHAVHRGGRRQAAVAVRLPGKLVVFWLNRDRAFSAEELLMLELLQPHLERVLQRCTQYLALRTKAHLTPRECETLHWVCEGKRDSEIAGIMKLSVRTVEQHVRACLKKIRFRKPVGRDRGSLARAKSRNRSGGEANGRVVP
jgi:DNA-binding CsgD family transcriptional regulator